MSQTNYNHVTNQREIKELSVFSISVCTEQDSSNYRMINDRLSL